jgi:VanZ family protein
MIQLYHKKAIWFSLFVICTILIIYMSVRPSASEILKKQFFELRMDYLLHLLAYFTFSSLYVLWRANSQFEIKMMELAIVTATAISFSILIEYIQLFIPTRAFNVVDMFYNLIGVLGGVGFTYFYFIRRFLRKRYKSK